MKTIYLVSCVSAKKASAAAAKKLYVSDLFTKARTYVESIGVPWFILSAEHGLLHPDDVIPPYNKTLNWMPIQERRVWGRNVFAKLTETLQRGDHAVFFAGAKYREFLVPALADFGVKVTIPLEGKRIGEQLSWFKGKMNER